MKEASESLINRIRRFYADNPSEFLTYSDMASKFNASEYSCKRACEGLRHAGVIESLLIIRAIGQGVPSCL